MTNAENKILDDGIHNLDKALETCPECTKKGMDEWYHMLSDGGKAILTQAILKHTTEYNHGTVYRLLKELQKHENLPDFDHWLNMARKMAMVKDYCHSDIISLKLPDNDMVCELCEFAEDLKRFALDQRNVS